jgi:hypothetical protein
MDDLQASLMTQQWYQSRLFDKNLLISYIESFSITKVVRVACLVGYSGNKSANVWMKKNFRLKWGA